MKKLIYPLLVLLASCGAGTQQHYQQDSSAQPQKETTPSAKEMAAAGMPVVYKVAFKPADLQLANATGTFSFHLDTSSLIDYRRDIQAGISQVLMVHFKGTFTDGSGGNIITGDQQLIMDDGSKVAATGNLTGNHFTPSGGKGSLNFQIPNGRKPVKLLLHAGDNDQVTEVIVTSETRPFGEI